MMASLASDIRARRTASLVFAGIWLVAWILTAALWIYDTAGYSAGMHPLTTLFHFILPLAVGAMAGWALPNSPDTQGLWQSIKRGSLAGLLAAAINFVILLIWSGILIGMGKAQPDPAMSVWSGLFEALSMGLAYCIVGLILGAVGGLVGGLLLTIQRARTQPHP